MVVEPPEGDVVGRMQEEVETEDVKETDQISVGTGVGSGAGEDHIEVFRLAKRESSGQQDCKELYGYLNLQNL